MGANYFAMKLYEYFEKHRITYTAWASENKLPGSSICLHLAWERGLSTGRRLGFDLSCEAVLATNGEVTLADLWPEKVAKLEKIHGLPQPAPYER